MDDPWTPLKEKYEKQNPYFECDIGWYDLLDDLLGQLVKMNPDFTVHQIKEKFGTLRFYCQSTTEEQDELVTKMEDRSADLCESCGDAGDIRGSGWVRTLCDECDRERRRV